MIGVLQVFGENRFKLSNLFLMLFDQFWEVFNFATNGDFGLNPSRVELIRYSNNALVISEIGLKIAYDQRTRVQAVLIIGTLKIGAAQTMNTTVVVPQKVTDDEVPYVGYHDLSPQSVSCGG